MSHNSLEKMKLNDQKKLYRQNALIQSDIFHLPISRFLDVTVVSGKCAESIRCIVENYLIFSELKPITNGCDAVAFSSFRYMECNNQSSG